MEYLVLIFLVSSLFLCINTSIIVTTEFFSSLQLEQVIFLYGAQQSV